MTRESVAAVLGVPLALQPHLLEQIKGMMGSRYTENNARQAYIPPGRWPSKTLSALPRLLRSNAARRRSSEPSRCPE